MSFHPNSNLPDCMMPDGGECCAGYAAVCEDWYKQRKHIKALEEILNELADLMDAVRTHDYTPDSFTTQPARIILKLEQNK